MIGITNRSYHNVFAAQLMSPPVRKSDFERSVLKPVIQSGTLLLKPVQRRQHQCFVLRSVIFSVTEFQSLNASLCEQDFGHWPRDFHLAKTHHIRIMFLFFSCRREATHRQVYVLSGNKFRFQGISGQEGVWAAAGNIFWSIQPAAGWKNIVFSPPQAEIFGI